MASIAILLVAVSAAPATAAQDASPAGSSDGITLAASGLDNPRGIAWGADGTMYVAQAGSAPGSASGHAPSGNGTPGVPHVALTGSLSGSVVWMDNACPVAFQDNLPSAGGTGGLDLGPSSVTILNGQIYVLDEGGGAAHGNPLTPDGVYAIDGSGSARLVADIGAWVAANPVADLPEDVDPNGDVVAMVASRGALLVLESNSGQLLSVTPDGSITRTADLSEGNMRPTGLAVASDGTAYVGFRTHSPFVEGAAKVVSISTDGTVSDAWTGLTAVTDVAVGSDGSLYALEFGTPDDTLPLNVAPNSGRVVRQTGPESFQEIAVAIDTPVAMSFGPDQGLYVSTPAISAEAEAGAVIRLNLSQGQVMTMSPEVLATSPCLPATTPTPDVTPVASPTGSAETPEAGTPESNADSATVSIENFAFTPNAITVPVGTTITWTNNDTSPHTVTSTDGTFDSANIAPGDTFTFTFTEAGTFDYICSYHPNMTATVVVE